MSDLYKIIDFCVKSDQNGKLVPIEGCINIPFDIKRVYYIWGTKRNVIREQHSHKNLKQVIVCVSGSCDFTLDNGKKRETVHLSEPSRGLYLESNIWREFTNFTPDCVVVVIASEHYDESDYIRDYNQFKKEIEK